MPVSADEPVVFSARVRVPPPVTLSVVVPLFDEQDSLPELYRRGLRTTINTDDPSISRITLSHEYHAACEDLSMPQRKLRECILAAAQAGFLPEQEKENLVDRLKKDLKI